MPNEQLSINQEILRNIALAYISGLVFYIVTTHIPNRINQRQQLNLIQSSLAIIYDNMSHIIAILDHEFKMNPCADLECDYIINYGDVYVYTKIDYFVNGRYQIHLKSDGYNIHRSLRKQILLIQENLRKIKEMISSCYIEADLSRILSEIEICNLFIMFNHYYERFEIEKKYGMDCAPKKFKFYCKDKNDDDFLQFKILRSRLGKYVLQKRTYSCTEMSQKEIEHCKKFRKEMEEVNAESLVAYYELTKKYN